MKLMLLVATFFAISSCGNPHLKMGSEFVRNTPTLGGEPVDTSVYVGAEEFAYPYQGESSSGFSIDIDEKSRVDFTKFEEGKFDGLMVNEGGVSIQILHKTEALQGVNGALNLENYYSVENFDLTVKKIIENGVLTSDGIGVDTSSTDAISKDVLLFNFSQPLKAFGGYFFDVESTSFVPAVMRLFDCSGYLLEQKNIVFSQGSNGNDKIHFIGFTSTDAVCSMGLTVGDYEGGNGGYRGLALDEVVFAK